MHLDSLTLMIPAALATALNGLFLLGCWSHFRAAPALRWWGIANEINGVGLAVLTAGFASHISSLVLVGAGLMTMVPPLIWGGFRRFNNERAPPLLLAAGGVVWLATAVAPFDHDHEKWSTLAGFASWCAYLSAAIWELWRTREEKLNARWPLAAFLAVHAAIFFGASIELLSGIFVLNEAPKFDTFFGAIHFETILYAMGTGIFMVLMCKERLERGYITAARVDALTGVANRGSFFEDAGRLFSRCQREGSPFSLIMFDLDHFKMVNDMLGHQAGDELLRSFADTIRIALRPNDLVGRYGGEEFIVGLPGATIETAYVIAERVRHAFANAHRFLGDRPLNATVSGGVASASSITTLHAIIGAADKAMYAAKKNGRNCIKRTSDDHPPDRDKIISIA